jgi:ribonuclease VapC
LIVVDTSAVMAILLGEPRRDACIAALEAAPAILMSAPTLSESLIVGRGRGVLDETIQLVDGLGVQVVDLTASGARHAADAYARWGRGVHPAGLNFGDCFAYALAKQRSCPLLFVGDDFARTDVQRAI